MGSPDQARPTPEGPLRRAIRRVIVGAVVGAQLTMVILAYGAPHRVFGFQMFPESSLWQAEIVRVTADGRVRDVRDPWPGGYTWEGLVEGRGLGSPFAVQHADAGLDSTLGFLDFALDWVADHTPDDHETVYLEARVRFWENGRGPQEEVLRSEHREGVG